MFDIAIGSHTDVGDVKQTNQDCVLYKTGLLNNHSVGLFIVADGCGGLAFGEEISKLAVTYFNRLWDTELKELFNDKKITDKMINDFLDKAIRDINVAAVDFGKQVGKQVGTTLSLLLTIDKRYYIKNIGDSRVYLIRRGKIQQLTEDQSLVANMIRNKELTQEEAKNFGNKNVLTMCIGLFEDVKTYTKIGKIRSKDLFLVCCDGLWGCIPEASFNKLLTKPCKKGLETTAKMLRDSIPQGDAKDNVSLVLANFKKKDGRQTVRILKRFLVFMIMVLLLVYAFHKPIGKWVESQAVLYKPVIYLYPQEETDVFVNLDIDESAFTCTYPDYNGGWHVRAKPDGTLINSTDNREYSYLFWEALNNTDWKFNDGFIVSKEETVDFLCEKLSYLGLTPKEYNEFIVYWLPHLLQNEYNIIRFAGLEYTESVPLNIFPKPDSVLRVFMLYKNASGTEVIKEQKIFPFERSGFTVVEWGGTEVR